MNAPLSLRPDGAAEADASDPFVPRVDRDLAYTPIAVAWACVQLLAADLAGAGTRVWEPHAGAGAWLQALALHNPELRLYGSDIDPAAPALAPTNPWWARTWDALGGCPIDPPDWIIGNPPYSHLDVQIRRALANARTGVAFLICGQAVAPAARDWMWDEARPDEMYWLRERVAFGGPGRDGRSTDMREYAFVVWRRDSVGTWGGRGLVNRVSWRGPKVWWGGRPAADLPKMPGPLFDGSR